ncbi:MAG: cytochrome c3 family protein [Victivallaceae bacterium]
MVEYKEWQTAVSIISLHHFQVLPKKSVWKIVKGNIVNAQKIISVAVLFALWSGYAHAAGDLPTKFTNIGSIGNTRHNMTQQQASGGGPNASVMDYSRNNYGEVCVYCHTPHGANTTVALPLWNRTMKATTYTTYNQLGTSSLTQTVSQPGAASLACLSCHDGQTAIDSIVNMPGSGRYDAAQMTTQNTAFLDAWPGTQATGSHVGLSDPGCVSCHKPGVPGATDFTVFAIGTDLTNDHPVGITFPAVSGPGTDFRTPGGVKGTTRYFDDNGNGKFDTADVRLYDAGGVVQVECASCHDPHGVPSAGPGSVFKPTFLRVSNAGSVLCLTCHDK